MSASESICAPNGLATPSLRARAPSRPSKTTQAIRQSAASADVAVHGEEDREHAEQQAGQGAGVDEGELHPAGGGALAGQQRDRARRRRRGRGGGGTAGLTGTTASISRGLGPATGRARVGPPTPVHRGRCRTSGGGAGEPVAVAATDPDQEHLAGESAAAAQPACPATPCGARTVRRTTPAPWGSRHVSSITGSACRPCGRCRAVSCRTLPWPGSRYAEYTIA